SPCSILTAKSSSTKDQARSWRQEDRSRLDTGGRRASTPRSSWFVTAGAGIEPAMSAARQRTTGYCLLAGEITRSKFGDFVSNSSKSRAQCGRRADAKMSPSFLGPCFRLVTPGVVSRLWRQKEIRQQFSRLALRSSPTIWCPQESFFAQIYRPTKMV